MIFKKPNELTNEELIKLKKILNLMLLILIVIILVSYVVILLTDKRYYNSASFFIPVILLSPLYFNFKRLNDIKREIRTRNLN